MDNEIKVTTNLEKQYQAESKRLRYKMFSKKITKYFFRLMNYLTIFHTIQDEEIQINVLNKIVE